MYIIVFWGLPMKRIFSFSHQTLLLLSKAPNDISFNETKLKKFFSHYVKSSDTFQVSDEINISHDHKAIYIRNPHYKAINVTITHLHHNGSHTITLKPKQVLLFVHDKLRGVDREHGRVKVSLVKRAKVLGYDIRLLELKLNEYDVQYRVIVHKNNLTRLIKDENDAKDLPRAVYNEVRRLLRKYSMF